MKSEKIELTEWNPVEDIETPEDAKMYLEAALEENDTKLLLAVLGDIARSKAMQKISKFDSDNFVRTFSEGNIPSFDDVIKAIDVLGFKFSIQQKSVA